MGGALTVLFNSALPSQPQFLGDNHRNPRSRLNFDCWRYCEASINDPVGDDGSAPLDAVAEGILDGVDDIAFCQLTNHDVVRHKLVGRIVAAYDRFESTQHPEKRRERR